MNVADLIIFKTIYEVKSLNKTAQLLGYTQSNITARLKTIEADYHTLFFTRNHTGVTATVNGEKMYSFVVRMLSELETLKDSFNDKQPKLLTSELLLNFLILTDNAFSINFAEIILKKTSQIPVEAKQHTFDRIITFAEINSKSYRLQETKALAAGFLRGKKAKTKKLPILINSDCTCPFRQLTQRLIENTSLIEVDSLENILQLIKQGKATALLPEFLIDENYLKADTNSWSIDYYTYVLR